MEAIESRQYISLDERQLEQSNITMVTKSKYSRRERLLKQMRIWPKVNDKECSFAKSSKDRHPTTPGNKSCEILK